VQTGNSTLQKSDLFQNVIWRQLSPNNLAYLDMGSDLEMKRAVDCLVTRSKTALWEDPTLH
jgi:hypothetical protein